MHKADKVDHLFIASNRLPISIERKRQKISFKPSPGGLVSGLKNVVRKNEAKWIGHSGLFEHEDGFGPLSEELSQQGFIAVPIKKKSYNPYYNGMSNGAIWPLFHYFPNHARFTEKEYDAYCEVNYCFAKKVVEVAPPGSAIWVHDYQLMILPRLLREANRDYRIAYFHHIPFPSSELLRILPAREEILEGILGADLIGFHTFDYGRHFLSSVARILGHNIYGDAVHIDNRIAKVSSFPLGIDIDSIDAALAKESDAGFSLQKSPTQQLFLGVDRLDYSKGIPERLQAFQSLLRNHRELVGKIIFIQICVPSRSEVKAYGNQRSRIEGIVSEINGEFGSPGYTPVQYLLRSYPLEDLVHLYQLADVMVVTPLRDGLNLVCKEYVASRTKGDGVLILSEFAGASSEMGEALVINPFDVKGLANAMYRAVHLPEVEKQRRMKLLRDRVRGFSNAVWSEQFISYWRQCTESNSSSELFSEDHRTKLLEKTEKARHIFLFSDFDGTLVPIVSKPEMAKLSPRTIEILARLKKSTPFELAIVTGRDRNFCESNFANLGINLASEHGMFVQLKDANDWMMLHGIEEFERLKSELLFILNSYARSVPGSKIEEKECSIVWHYRNSPEYAESQAQLLKDELRQMLSDTPYGAYGGKKIVDIRPVLANKGHAAEIILEHHSYDPEKDLLITLGDDQTDEDLFRVFPRDNTSFSIGKPNPYARFHLNSQREVDDLLLDLLGGVEPS